MQNVIQSVDLPFHKLENVFGTFVPVLDAFERTISLGGGGTAAEASMVDACLSVIQHLRVKLSYAETGGDEEVALAFAGTLARLSAAEEAVEVA
jgi:hypothetical protein